MTESQTGSVCLYSLVQLLTRCLPNEDGDMLQVWSDTMCYKREIIEHFDHLSCSQESSCPPEYQIFNDLTASGCPLVISNDQMTVKFIHCHKDTFIDVRGANCKPLQGLIINPSSIDSSDTDKA